VSGPERLSPHNYTKATMHKWLQLNNKTTYYIQNLITGRAAESGEKWLHRTASEHLDYMKKIMSVL
jgi:hypothetical protein